MLLIYVPVIVFCSSLTVRFTHFLLTKLQLAPFKTTAIVLQIDSRLLSVANGFARTSSALVIWRTDFFTLEFFAWSLLLYVSTFIFAAIFVLLLLKLLENFSLCADEQLFEKFEDNDYYAKESLNIMSRLFIGKHFCRFQTCIFC